MKNFYGICATLLCIVYFLSTSSCVTILGDGKNSTAEITSSPSGADVYDQFRVKLGTTPYTISSMTEKKTVLTIQKNGYEDENVEIRRHSKSGLLFLDAMLLCIPCIVDLNQPDKLYSIEAPAETILLKKKLKEYEKELPAIFNTVDITFEKQMEIGKVNGIRKSMASSGIEKIIGYSDYFDGSVVDALQSGFFKLYYKQSSWKADVANRPKFSISVSIKNLSFDLKGESLKTYAGPCSMKTEWRIYKFLEGNDANEDPPIATFYIESSLSRKKGSTDYLVPALLGEAGINFMANDTLYDFLNKVIVESVAAQKGDIIKIKGGTSIKSTTPSKDRFKNAIQAVVTIKGKNGFGSGFIISSDGFVITNYHVVQWEKSLTVKLNQNISLNGEVVKYNPDYDLALLKLNATDLVALPFANSDEAEIGEEVYAIGTPSDIELGQSITKGIISGKRVLENIGYIQSDVSISPGNSGGPLLNDKGQVIGVTTMKMVGKGIEGVGFSIPSNVVIEMLNISIE